jgi:hypothetical protein
MCLDAYREALTRDLSSTASPAPGQCQAGETGREGVAGPAMALANDATVMHGEVIDQR